MNNIKNIDDLRNVMTAENMTVYQFIKEFQKTNKIRKNSIYDWFNNNQLPPARIEQINIVLKNYFDEKAK